MRLLRREALENSVLAVTLAAVLLVLAAGALDEAEGLRDRVRRLEARADAQDALLTRERERGDAERRDAHEDERRRRAGGGEGHATGHGSGRKAAEVGLVRAGIAPVASDADAWLRTLDGRFERWLKLRR